MAPCLNYLEINAALGLAAPSLLDGSTGYFILGQYETKLDEGYADAFVRFRKKNLRHFGKQPRQDQRIELAEARRIIEYPFLSILSNRTAKLLVAFGG